MITSKCGIYKITNTVTGDFYIGSSDNIRYRFYHHRNALSNNRHPNVHLQRAWNKYGADSFVYVPVLLCDIENKLYYEQVLIDGLKPHYNIATCARASGQGRAVSDETRRKISEVHMGNKYNLGRKATEETRRKLSEVHKGKLFTEEHKRKIGSAQTGELNWNFGKCASEESKRKMSEARTGHPVSEETRHKISEGLRGKLRTEETRQNMSEAQKGKRLGALNPMFGKQHTEETRAKISDARQRYEKRKADAQSTPRVD